MKKLWYFFYVIFILLITLQVAAALPALSTDVVLTVKIGGDSQYRTFWVNGSWDANGNYDPMWSGPMVELNDNGTGADAVAGDTYFTGSVQLAIDNVNTYHWWAGSENDLGSFLDDGNGFNVTGTVPVYPDTLILDGDGGINEWVVSLPGAFNNWNNSDDMSRDSTVWSKVVHLTAGTYEYKYAVMHQWSAAYGNGGIGGAFPNYSYTVPSEGDYLFSFDDADNSQFVSMVVALSGERGDIPKTFDLMRNYPNPFNPLTTITYQVPEQRRVSIRVYNLLGQKLRTLIDAPVPAGIYKVTWDGKDERGELVGSGIYFYQMRAGEFVKSYRMVLIR